MSLTSIKHDIIPNVLCINTKITLIKIKMASFSSYLLVFFLASLILIPQGFGSHPHHDQRKHPPSTQGFGDHPRNEGKHKPPSTYVHPIHPTTLPKPHKPPHHPPKEDNTHF